MPRNNSSPQNELEFLPLYELVRLLKDSKGRSVDPREVTTRNGSLGVIPKGSPMAAVILEGIGSCCGGSTHTHVGPSIRIKFTNLQ